jgi:hypothetical protein
MWHRVFFIIRHFRQHISDNSIRLHVHCHVRQMRPRQLVVKIVFHCIVFWQACQIRRLDRQQVVHRRPAYRNHRLLEHAQPTKLRARQTATESIQTFRQTRHFTQFTRGRSRGCRMLTVCAAARDTKAPHRPVVSAQSNRSGCPDSTVASIALQRRSIALLDDDCAPRRMRSARQPGSMQRHRPQCHRSEPSCLRSTLQRASCLRATD